MPGTGAEVPTVSGGSPGFSTAVLPAGFSCGCCLTFFPFLPGVGTAAAPGTSSGVSWCC